MRPALYVYLTLCGVVCYADAHNIEHGLSKIESLFKNFIRHSNKDEVNDPAGSIKVKSGGGRHGDYFNAVRNLLRFGAGNGEYDPSHDKDLTLNAPMNYLKRSQWSAPILARSGYLGSSKDLVAIRRPTPPPPVRVVMVFRTAADALTVRSREVPIQPALRVYGALWQAAGDLQLRRDAENCYTISSLGGSRAKKYIIVLSSRYQKPEVQYLGTCMPTNVLLKPNDTVFVIADAHSRQ